MFVNYRLLYSTEQSIQHRSTIVLYRWSHNFKQRSNDTYDVSGRVIQPLRAGGLGHLASLVVIRVLELLGRLLARVGAFAQ
jgi:hypothetical protein